MPNNISKSILFHLQWDPVYFSYVRKTTNEEDKNYTMSYQIQITRSSDNNIRKHPCILTDSDMLVTCRSSMYANFRIYLVTWKNSKTYKNIPNSYKIIFHLVITGSSKGSLLTIPAKLPGRVLQRLP